jgi:hypothetical protein|tara:strand:+ start:422 stop:1399 length:978 start_codon:yes stop_codon:yes gene_type:complete
MRTLNDFIHICEKYNDEHAHRKVWNHFIVHGKFGKTVRDALSTDETGTALSHMKSEIEKALKDPKHPLSFERAKRGFPSKGKDEGSRDSYNKELRDAVSGVYALATQKKFRRAVSGQQPARVTGGSDPNAQLSRTWRSGGGTNRTPKGDLEVYNPRNPKERRGVSMKKGGGSQLASAEPGEMQASYKSAAKTVAQRYHGDKSKDQRREIIKDIRRRAGKASRMLQRMKTGSPEGNELRKKASQRMIDRLHGDYPNLTRHLSQVSASGDTKFRGRNAPGTAGTILTGVNKDKPATAKPIEQQPSANPRLAKPKGRNRPGNLKIDNR